MRAFKKIALVAVACAAVLVVHAADRVRIVNEGGIRDQWLLADGLTLAAPGYPAALAERGDNVCIALGYSIRPDGTTADFTLLKAWSSATAESEPMEGFWDEFAQAGAGAVSQWRFKPRPEMSTPLSTYTVATMHFMGKHAEDAAALRSHCAIADLPTLVQAQKAYKYQRGNRERNELERFRRTIEAQRALIDKPGRALVERPKR